MLIIRAREPLAGGGVPGPPGVEGEHEPPLICGKPQVEVAFQLDGDLVGQGHGGLSLPGPAQQIDGGLDAGFP